MILHEKNKMCGMCIQEEEEKDRLQKLEAEGKNSEQGTNMHPRCLQVHSEHLNLEAMSCYQRGPDAHGKASE